jgi:hypothetical protein
MLKFRVISIGLLVLFGCGDECSSYSKYSCKKIESASYNVIFSFPNDPESRFIGTASGLSGCGAVAHSYASSKNLVGREWGYVCCMKASTSECEEKHR